MSFGFLPPSRTEAYSGGNESQSAPTNGSSTLALSLDQAERFQRLSVTSYSSFLCLAPEQLMEAQALAWRTCYYEKPPPARVLTFSLAGVEDLLVEAAS